jgi:hypothetical protein
MTIARKLLWASGILESSVIFEAAAYSPTLGIYVVVGGGLIVTSRDGINWAPSPMLTDINFTGVAWCDTEFVLVSPSGLGYSLDGVNFDFQSISPFSADKGLADNGNGTYVCAGGSLDCISGLPPSAEVTSTYSAFGEYSFYDVAWTGSEFIAVGYVVGSSTESGVIASSPDGINWTIGQIIPPTSYSNNGLYCVTASPNMIVAAGETQIVSSPNGSSWTVRDSSVSGYLYKGICWSGSLFVVVGLGGLIKTSPDGETWTTRAPSGSGNWQLYGVNWCGSLFIATGTHGTILTSPDGINWTDR